MNLGKDLVDKMAYRLGLGCWLLFFQFLYSNPLTIPHRGLWVRGMSIASPDSIPRIIKIADEFKITDLYVQVIVGGYAYYKSEILPRSEYLAKNSASDYDPLDFLIKIAKKKNLRVHAWVNALLIWSMDSLPDSTRHINYVHSDWFLNDVYGRSMINYSSIERQDFGIEGTFLDPGKKEVREYLKTICTEILKKYPVDGIHLDFIRYPGIFWGIEDTLQCALISGLNSKDLRWLTLLRYAQLNLFDRWIVYNFYLANKERQKAISRLAEDIYSTIKKCDNNCILSCAVVSNPSRALYQYSQNWWEWKGIIDYPVVMSYTTDIYLFKDFLDFSMYHTPTSIIGIGFLWKGMEMQVNTEIDFVRKKGGTGICYFDFASLDTMADLNISVDSSSVLSDSLPRINAATIALDSVFFELPKAEWTTMGMNYIKYGEDLDFARFLLSLSINPEEDFKKMGIELEDFLKNLRFDAAGFEYLNRKLLVMDKRLLEPPSRDIEYTFIRWNNSDSNAVRNMAKKAKKLELKMILYPEAMNPLAKAVFEAKKGEKKIVETKSGIYIFRVKKVKEGGKWVKKTKIKQDLIPLYIYSTISQKFNELYYGK